MIFITLGSQKFQFNRLLKAVDSLVENGCITEKVFAQIGYSDYKPLNYDYKQFLDRDEFEETIRIADIVITHGGTGAIIGAVKKGKKVIAVPRLAEYGEHVDNHQRQLVGQFKNMDLIFACDDCSELEVAIEHTRLSSFKSYESNTAKIINSIEKFIQGE
ncbi:MAG: beta(1,3)galactosyltransferase EpsH [Clostridia bacterium]|nr:beta(1,3)galactosyltransferase EpsH [Clostridia bacterium]